jgi:outer membrane protein assembly factor BamB
LVAASIDCQSAAPRTLVSSADERYIEARSNFHCLSGSTAMKYASLMLFALVLTPQWSPAADWPQWRGVHRDSISQETGLLPMWPEGGPKLVWHAKDIGDGYSTPSVAGDSIYLLSSRGIEDESVLALNAKDGSQLWSTRLGKVGNPEQKPSYPGARSTPTVDGDWLYAFSSDGDLACLDRKTGQPRWQKNVREAFGGEYGEWAYSESPLVDGDRVLVTPGGPEATLVCLDKATGDLIWKCDSPDKDKASYSSMIIANIAGVKQYVQFIEKGLVGVDAQSGKILWKYERTAKGSMANIPTPVEAGGFIYSATGRVGGGLVEVKRAADGLVAEQVYFEAKLPTGIGGAVLVDGYLYGTSSRAMMCIDFKTGELKWEDKSVGPSSICYADGRLYLHGDTDDVALLEPSPEGYRERGRFSLPDQPDRGRSKAWAYPVIANGRLYFRDLGSLWCYDIGQK